VAGRHRKLVLHVHRSSSGVKRGRRFVFPSQLRQNKNLWPSKSIHCSYFCLFFHTSVTLPRHLCTCFHANTFGWKLLCSFRFPFKVRAPHALQGLAKTTARELHSHRQLLPHVVTTVETSFPSKAKFSFDFNKD